MCHLKLLENGWLQVLQFVWKASLFRETGKFSCYFAYIVALFEYKPELVSVSKLAQSLAPLGV